MGDAPARVFLYRIAAPLQLFVLAVALAQLPGDLRSRQLNTKVERVRSIVIDLEVRIQAERIHVAVQAFTIENTDALLAHQNTEARILDLCRQFGENASVQLRDGDTTGCEQSALLPAALRMFVTSSAYTPHGTHPSVDVYFIPWSPTVQVNVQAEASAETEALANDVRGAIGQSLNKSNCPWTIDEQKFQELPKSG